MRINYRILPALALAVFVFATSGSAAQAADSRDYGLFAENDWRKDAHRERAKEWKEEMKEKRADARERRKEWKEEMKERRSDARERRNEWRDRRDDNRDRRHNGYRDRNHDGRPDFQDRNHDGRPDFPDHRQGRHDGRRR